MNEARAGFFFSLSRALTESLWVIAFAGSVLHAVGRARFSIAAGMLAFLCAALVTRLTRHRAMLRITALLVHAVGLGACTVVALWAAGLWKRSLVGVPGWSLESAAAALTILWVLVLWWKGNASIRKPATHDRVCEQFDKGITAFGALFFVTAFIRIKWGLEISWAPTFHLFTVFFLAGISAVGSSPSTWKAPVSPLSRPGAWAFLLFGILILGAGLGVVSLFMPALHKGAELGMGAIKTTASPMGPWIVRILRFIFAPRALRLDSAGGASGGPDLPYAGGEEKGAGMVEWILAWGLGGLLVAAAAAAACVLLYYALKILLSRGRAQVGNPSADSPLLAFLRRLIKLLGQLSIRKAIADVLLPSPLRIYRRLNGWGRRSGMPRRPSETPLEYGRRLSSVFFALSGDIHTLVDLVNADAYGGDPLGRRERVSALHAWRHIRSPAFWPARARFLIMGHPGGLSRANGMIMLLSFKIQALWQNER